MLRPTTIAKELSKLYSLPIKEVDAVVKGVIKSKPNITKAEMELMAMKNLDLITSKV